MLNWPTLPAVIILAPQHENNFFQAGNKNIDIGQGARHNGPPSHLTAFAGRVRQGHIERGDDAHVIHALVNIDQHLAIIGEQTRQQRRIAQVENFRLRDQIKVNIGIAELLVITRAMENDAVGIDRREND